MWVGAHRVFGCWVNVLHSELDYRADFSFAIKAQLERQPETKLPVNW